MPSPIENAVTLGDVFAMVQGKRVPLAPELAGYLTLEIAEKAEAGGSGGSVDPASVYIADEGTVALVRRPREPGDGDTEPSIRAILARLLEASGSSTPALTAVSRKTGAGALRGLMEEIEASLIPVNRAAGRRALARLAREVKRVTQGVGRNAPSTRLPTGESTARASRPGTEELPPPPRAVPPRREAPPPPPPLATRRPPPQATGRATSSLPPSRPVARAGETRAFPVPDDPRLSGPPERLQDSPTDRAPPPAEPRPAVAVPSALFDRPSDVDSLLEQFSRSTTQSAADVSRDLKQLADLGETALPPAVGSRRPPALSGSSAGDVDDLLALTVEGAEAAASVRADADGPTPSFASRTEGVEPPVELVAKVMAVPEVVPSTRPPPRPDEWQDTEPPRAKPPSSAPLPARPAARALPSEPSVATPSAEWARPRKKRTDYWIILAVLSILAAASAAVWLFKPGFFSGRTADKVAEEKAANDAARQKALLAQQALRCQAAVDVTDVPSGAEVLLRVGQAPIDVPHLPVGTRLEFVATAEGYAPKRVVVPAGAPWDKGPDGKPRFEVAVQLDHSNPKAKLGDSWPAGEPGSEVGGKGAPGTVHVVSTPRGAELWMLAGLGPEAVIEQLPCDQGVDILVAGPTTYRKRLHAAATDFTPRPGEAEARLAKLNAR